MTSSLSVVKDTVSLDMLVKFTVIHFTNVGIKFLLAVYIFIYIYIYEKKPDIPCVRLAKF